MNRRWQQTQHQPKPTFMSFWKDLEGAAKRRIKEMDLYIPDWPKTRRREGVVFPQIGKGARFIKILGASSNGLFC